MMRLRRLAAWPLCLTLLLGIFLWGGCTRDEGGGGSGAASGGSNSAPKRIIIVTNGPDPFWDTCEAGAKAAEKDLGLLEAGYVVDFQRGDFTDKKQIDMLKQYVIASDVAAVAISVFNPESLNLATEMQTLQENGVKIITIDSDISRENYRDSRFAYLGTDNIIGGRELGRAAKALAPKGAKFAFFVGDLGVANAVERMNGFTEGAGSNFTELTRLSDGADKPKSRTNVESVLNQYAECDMLVGIWAYNTPLIVSVVKDRGIKEKTRVVGFDAGEAAIEEMGNGNVDVMVVQNPYQMGYDGVKLLHALASGAGGQATVDAMFPSYALEGEHDVFRTELRVVAPDEGSPLNKDLFDPTTIFFKYSDFKTWLKERGLVSS